MTVGKTEFAPAERATEDRLERQWKSISTSPWVVHVANATSDGLVILNHHRQIVFANRIALKLLGAREVSTVLGKRLGEALGCMHSVQGEGGCGTSNFCRTCGAVRATLVSINERKQDVEECQVTTTAGDAFDFQVTATPLEFDDVPYTLFALTDISGIKRRQALERIFFHDVMNTAGGLRGFSEMLKDAPAQEAEDFRQCIYELSATLIDEIDAQRDLVGAENRELSLQLTPVNGQELIEAVRRAYSGQMMYRCTTLEVDTSSVSATLVTDAHILRRVIGNMAKNALEASQAGDTVRLKCELSGDEIVFSVWNRHVIAPDAQLQIFNRSFSTKGQGRGLGTYGMKLLTERYLKGRVWFRSAVGAGTTFFAAYPKNQDSIPVASKER